MLSRLKIENFKAWREVDLALGKVTGLFGTNSAGKSSLLQFLLLLKQTRNATDRRLVLDFGGPGGLVNLGTFADVVHRHEDDGRIRWILEWTLPGTLKILDPTRFQRGPLFAGDSLRTECEVGLRQARLRPHRLAYRFDEEEFRVQPQSGSEDQFELVAESDSKDFKLMRGRGRPRPLPHPVKSYLFPSQAKTYFQNADFLGDFELEYEKLMDSIFYLGPLREYPRREYHWAGSSPEDVGQRGERAVDAILAATRDNK